MDMPQTGDIWLWHHTERDEADCVVLIHEFLHETRSLANKPVMVFWGYDMLTDQYDEWLFTEDSLDKYWRKLG